MEKRKLVTVSWTKSCLPINQGGLGLRSLSSLNEASNLKLSWDVRISNQSWAKLLQSRCIRNMKPVSYHIFSSIWSSIKSEFQFVSDHSGWQIGKGDRVNFWNDNWCGMSLSNLLNIPDTISQNLQASVEDFISEGIWRIPDSI